SDATVINNTAVNNSNGGIDLGVSSNDVVANNILYNNKVYGLKLRNAQALVDNNLYYSVTSSLPLAIDSGQSYLTLAALRAGTGRELHGLNADPGFVDPANNDYRLTWNSPAIAAATTTYAHASDYANGNVYGIPNIGAYEFQPPSSMGIDKVDIGAGAKIFGDGKFENAAAPNSNLADLSIAPPAGFSTYASTSTVPEWLDISNITVWNKAGDYHKRWTESSAVIGSASTVHTIGDLAPNTNYLVKVDNATTTISCPRGICRSNAQGKITFTYTGGYSTHDFDISEGDNTAPTVDTYSVGGAISGLSGSVVLQNNGKDNLTVSANGSFAFAIATTTGSAYSVSVLTNPSGQTCSVSSGSGTVASANVTTVSVSCANNSTPSSGGGGGGGIAADTTPPGIPANFSVISSSGQIILSWTNPADSDFAGAKLYRKINSAPTSQADPLAKLIYQGNGNIFTDTSAMPDALYYYSLYAYDTDGNYSSPAAIYVRVASGQISTSTVPVTIPVAKNQSDNSSPIASLIGASGALVNQVTAGETATLFANAQFVPLSEIEKQTYLKIIALAAKPLTQKIKYAIADFIHSGTPTTKILGAGERGGSIASFNSAFSRLPETATDWQDIIKIGNGRWTSQTSASSLARAKINFKLVYGRNPKMSDVHDNAAVTIMAYGLRPAQRNQASEKTAIKSFKFIFHKAPVSATDWDIVRAIAYSGAKR
ncbi:MAG TPA: hypothetical protein VMC41_02505, partial [Candidatus Nanoarchaeia archaeon]|nr:hypothetical protein [Candidatus Nanoarchaeia archaeon]